MKARCLIVEDEKHCAERLTILINRHHADEIEILSWENNNHDALNAIQQHKPDLVFLDIQLHQTDIFSMLKEIPEIDFNIIFTTAHREYAIDAIKFSALDYLLKPIDKDELKVAIQKHFSFAASNNYKKSLELLFEHLSENSARKKIGIPTLAGIEFVYIHDIIRCQSDINYTHIFLRDKRKLTVAKTLKEFEDMLTKHNFFRIHNSHLVNLEEVKIYHKGKGGYLILNDHSEIEVASRRKDDLLNLLRKI
jgi:two-component system, LytTR family, response regulator